MLLLKVRDFVKINVIKTVFKSNYSQFTKKTSKFSQCSRRNNSSFSIFKLFKKPTLEEIMRKDNLPSDYKMIYRSTMERYLTLGRIASVSSIGLVAITFLINGGSESFAIKPEKWAKEPTKQENEALIFFVILTTIAVVIHSIITRMPIRIYYNYKKKDSYIFVYQTVVPTTKRYIECLREDIAHMPEIGFMPWQIYLYRIGTRSGNFLFEDYFRCPADFHVMMGVQKPPDDDDEF